MKTGTRFGHIVHAIGLLLIGWAIPTGITATIYSGLLTGAAWSSSSAGRLFAEATLVAAFVLQLIFAANYCSFIFKTRNIIFGFTAKEDSAERDYPPILLFGFVFAIITLAAMFGSWVAHFVPYAELACAALIISDLFFFIAAAQATFGQLRAYKRCLRDLETLWVDTLPVMHRSNYTGKSQLSGANLLCIVTNGFIVLKEAGGILWVVYKSKPNLGFIIGGEITNINELKARTGDWYQLPFPISGSDGFKLLLLKNMPQ